MALSKIQAESMNLADTFAFTGTVSGTGYDLIANVYSASTVTSTEITLPTGYDSYYLELTALGDHSISSNWCLQHKREGQSSFDTSDYTTQSKLLDVTNNQVNANTAYAFMILMHSSGLTKYFGHQIYLNNYGRTDVANVMNFQTTQSKDGGSGSWVGGGCHTVEANNLARASAIKYFPANGNITRIQYKLFGIK
tara:strand:+ start:1062 stop:1646 length:585 start_codon:yes stop_codon:yes gene_type:complete